MTEPADVALERAREALGELHKATIQTGLANEAIADRLAKVREHVDASSGDRFQQLVVELALVQAETALERDKLSLLERNALNRHSRHSAPTKRPTAVPSYRLACHGHGTRPRRPSGPHEARWRQRHAPAQRPSSWSQQNQAMQQRG